MRPEDVKAFGADYSAAEFTPEQLDHYPEVKISWLARYIGYPSNRKCISYYPGAYLAHTRAGRPVALYHQVAYRDFEGGAASGRAHAQIALEDARSSRVGWDGESPIIACFDRRMASFTRQGTTYRAILLDEVRDYVAGFRSVAGSVTGFYGFEDTMGPAVQEGWASFYMQCGARSAHIPGITAWQENNVQPTLLGIGTDRLELYRTLPGVFGGYDVGIEATDLIEGTDPTKGWTEDGKPVYTEKQTPGNWWGSAAFNALRTREKVEVMIEVVKEMELRQATEATKDDAFRASVIKQLEGVKTGTGFTLAELAKAINDDAHARMAE